MKIYALAITLVYALISSTANALIIDDFTDGSMAVTANNLGLFINSNSSFGGGRNVSIRKMGLGNARADVITTLGLYAHSADASTSATSTISWSDTSGIDLVENLENNIFAFDIHTIDQGEITFNLSVTDLFNNTKSVSLSGIDAGIHNISFTSFSGLNFHQVTEISLQAIGGTASDFIINSLSTTGQISAVPVPPAFILFGSSIMILGLKRLKNTA